MRRQLPDPVAIPNSEVLWCAWPKPQIVSGYSHLGYFCSHDPWESWSWNGVEWFCDICDRGVADDTSGWEAQQKDRKRAKRRIEYVATTHDPQGPTDQVEFYRVAYGGDPWYATETAAVRSGAVTNNDWEHWQCRRDRTLENAPSHAAHYGRRRWWRRHRP